VKNPARLAFIQFIEIKKEIPQAWSLMEDEMTGWRNVLGGKRAWCRQAESANWA
jgi:hypothetical protein